MIKKITTYFSEARHELRSVQWPTRAEAIRLTLVVLGLSLAVSLFLGLADTLFSYLIKSFILG